MATVKKGDLLTLNLDGTDRQYRVLKVDGNNAECLAMFDASTSQKFNEVLEANSRIYAGSDLDIYLNTTWYNKLTDTAKSAIVPKTFTQDQWYDDDSGDPVYSGYFGSSSPGNMLYRVSLANSAFGSTITRNVYALSIQDVLDYVLDTAVGDGQWRNYNTWKMFWNDEAKHSLNHLWLRSAAKNFTTDVFYLNGNYGTFSTFSTNEPFRVRPAFTIDLVKLGVIEPDTSTVITYNDKTIAILEAGQTATVKTAQSEVEHDIIVKAAEQKEAVLQEKTVTENGEFTPDEGYDGLSKVTVNVPIPDGYIQPNGTLTVTENGTHNVAVFASVSVNVPVETVEEWDGTVIISGGLISFTIDSVTYQAEEGMTWAEWGADETYTKGDYNVLGDLYVYKSDTGQLVSNNADGAGDYVERTETIIADHNYGITPIGN